jgi:hypothetical protein
MQSGVAPAAILQCEQPSYSSAHLQPNFEFRTAVSVIVGVWAAGESWHYAPLAASLARLGVITGVMQYTLYPDALVPQLVQEVSAAFDWALKNVGSYGGDAKKVRLARLSPHADVCQNRGQVEGTPRGQRRADMVA